MSHVFSVTRIAAIFVACSVLAGQASAQTAQSGNVPLPAALIDREPQAPVDAFTNASALAETDLDQVTGREDTGAMVASATQRNTVSNNSVTGTSTTGNIQLTGNAFQNLQGLAVISANSGNNVAMNAAMNVTVNLAPR